MSKVITDIATVIDSLHSTPEYSEAGFPMVRVVDVNNEFIKLDKCLKVDEVTFNKHNKNHIPQKGDIIITRVGSFGMLGYVETDEKFCLGQNIAIIHPYSKSKYLYYYLSSPFLKKKLYSKIGGSAYKCIGLDDIRRLPYYDSGLDTENIGNILFNLDYKIVLNNRINAELEAMAKTVYDYWFVQFDFPFDFAQGKPSTEGKPYKSSGGKMVWSEELKRKVPEGWKIKNLESLGNFKNGVNYDPSNPGDVACPIINVRNISASSYFLKNEDLDVVYLKASDVRKYAVHEGSIIIARSGIPGATRLISDIAINTLYCGFAIHYELIDLSLKIPIFFFLKSIEQQIQNGSGGTIMKNVNQGTLNALQIALPTNNETITEFNKIIDPIFGKINLIQQENKQLSSLRDWLLPMLMNGQVKVGLGYEGEVESLMAAEAGEKYGK